MKSVCIDCFNFYNLSFFKRTTNVSSLGWWSIGYSFFSLESLLKFKVRSCFVSTICSILTRLLWAVNTAYYVRWMMLRWNFSNGFMIIYTNGFMIIYWWYSHSLLVGCSFNPLFIVRVQWKNSYVQCGFISPLLPLDPITILWALAGVWYIIKHQWSPPPPPSPSPLSI